MTSRTGSARRFWGDFEESQRAEILTLNEEVRLLGLAEAIELARYGRRARWGPDEKDNIERLYLSPYVEEALNSKVIKGSYLN